MNGFSCLILSVTTGGWFHHDPWVKEEGITVESVQLAAGATGGDWEQRGQAGTVLPH